MVPVRKDGPGLTREGIVRTALEIIDREGYKSLSMRRLGAELGVDPMAVYYHIPNKAALLDGVVEAVMAEIDVSCEMPCNMSTEEHLYLGFRAYREALLKHLQALPIMAARPLRTQASLKPVEVVLGVLYEAGFTPTDAMAAVNILAAYVRGAVLIEAHHLMDSEVHKHEDVSMEEMKKMLPPEQFPNLNRAMSEGESIGMEAEFDRGIKAFIRGLLETYANPYANKTE